MDLIELVRSAPWYKLIGMEPHLVEDRVVVELNISRTKHFQALGVAHGGVIASVLDSVIGLNVNKELLQRGKVAVTVQLNIHYLKPALEGKIIGEGKVVHVGSKIVVGYGEVKNSRGEIIATGTATYYITGESPIPQDRADLEC